MTKLPFTEKKNLEKNVTVKFTKDDYDNLVVYCNEKKYKLSYLIREIVLDWYNH